MYKLSRFSKLTEKVIPYRTLDSSVGRAGDCRGIAQASLGHWFESGSRDIFLGGSK